MLANFPGSTISSTSTLTPAFLSGVDVLFLISAQADGVGITPLSAAEKSAVYNFVLGGGGAIMMAEDYTDHPSAQSLVDPFGVTIADDGVSGLQSCTTPSHPIFDGPFGTQPFYVVYGSGAFTNLGPYATSVSQEQSTSLPVIASLESGVLGPGSGRVLMFGDVSAFADPIVDGGYFPQGEKLFLNSIAFVAAPEPTSIALAGVGLLAVALLGWRRGRGHHRRGEAARRHVNGTGCNRLMDSNFAVGLSSPTAAADCFQFSLGLAAGVVVAATSGPRQGLP